MELTSNTDLSQLPQDLKCCLAGTVTMAITVAPHITWSRGVTKRQEIVYYRHLYEGENVLIKIQR